MAAKIMLTGSDSGAIAEVGSLSKALAVVTAIHKRVHDGGMFQLDRVVEAVADDGTIELLVQVPAATQVHLRFAAAAAGDARISIFEGTTFSDAGTAMTAVNRNRVPTISTPGSVVTHTPTVTGDGTELSDVLIPGGSGGNASGGTDDGFQEWILAASTDYLVRLKNISGGAAHLGLQLNWYEPS